MTIKTRPLQKTLFVVRRGESESSKAVYRGDHAQKAANVAKAFPNATVTFKTERAFSDYLQTR